MPRELFAQPENSFLKNATLLLSWRWLRDPRPTRDRPATDPLIKAPVNKYDQIAEKKLLEHEDNAEEQRLNKLMEQERVSAIQAEELKERERTHNRKSFALFLKEQIKANEQERLLEYERKREESHLVNVNSIAQQEAALEKYKEKEAEQERARRDLFECNEQLKHFKAMEEEENRIMDIRFVELFLGT
jgi:hypothetical protein